MSGGAYEYAYHRIDELAGDIAAHTTGLLGRAQRKAFVEHLLRVAQVAKEVELADSGDTDGSEATRMHELLKRAESGAKESHLGQNHKCSRWSYSGEGYNRVRVCACGAEDHDPEPGTMTAVIRAAPMEES